MNPIDATRYPVRVGMHTTEDGEEVMLEIDELQRDHPRTFALWISLEPTRDEEQIARVCLAQAYADPVKSFLLASDMLSAIDVPPAIGRRVGDGSEEDARDQLYQVSRLIQVSPWLVTQDHRIARARLLACMSVNEIDTEGSEDPASLVLPACSCADAGIVNGEVPDHECELQ